MVEQPVASKNEMEIKLSGQEKKSKYEYESVYILYFHYYVWTMCQQMFLFQGFFFYSKFHAVKKTASTLIVYYFDHRVNDEYCICVSRNLLPLLTQSMVLILTKNETPCGESRSIKWTHYFVIFYRYISDISEHLLHTCKTL